MVDAGSPRPGGSEATVAPAGSLAPAARPARPGGPGPGTGNAAPALATLATVVLLLLFVLGFFAYLFAFSYVSEERAQAGLFKNFVGQLQNATAPVAPVLTNNATGKQSPLPEGSAVAVLSIPQIGLKDVVVVNGTSSRDLALGPGHVRASVLPGQAGISFIYGKVATYGAPFAHLMRLNRGDKFTVTTGQGTSTYQVESFGTSKSPAPDTTANRLVLETAAGGILPSSAVQVSADLVSSPKENPGGWPPIPAQEAFMGRDTADSLVPLALWSQALLLAVIVATIAANRWSRWRTYLIMSPVVLALLWCVYENLACLLPNLY